MNSISQKKRVRLLGQGLGMLVTKDWARRENSKWRVLRWDLRLVVELGGVEEDEEVVGILGFLWR